jgi:putative endonuclease
LEARDGEFWVYILQNPSGRLYIGSSNNLQRRLQEHNDSQRGNPTFTHKNGPWQLIWSEKRPSRSSAVLRERQIKNKKSAKWIHENLPNERVPVRQGCKFLPNVDAKANPE